MRHNSILQCIVKAILKEGRNVYVEQAISPENLRPDIVVHNSSTGEAVVADITVPYEADDNAFTKARQEKEQKYNGLKEWMLSQECYSKVSIHAFIVGSLGAWDEENVHCLRALHIARSYTPVFETLHCRCNQWHLEVTEWQSEGRLKDFIIYHNFSIYCHMFVSLFVCVSFLLLLWLFVCFFVIT